MRLLSRDEQVALYRNGEFIKGVFHLDGQNRFPTYTADGFLGEPVRYMLIGGIQVVEITDLEVFSYD